MNEITHTKHPSRTIIGLCCKTIVNSSGEDIGECGDNAIALWDWGGEYLPVCYIHDKEIRDKGEYFVSMIL